MSKELRKLRCEGANAFVYLIDRESEVIPGEACFYAKEYEWALKLATRHQTSDERNDFWPGIMENKRNNPRYSVYDGFPIAMPKPATAPLQDWTAEDRQRVVQGARACLEAIQRHKLNSERRTA